MKRFVIHWTVNFLTVMFVASFMPGIRVEGWFAAVVAGFMLSLLNVFVKPLIVLATLPLTILSLGLFTLVINTFILYLSAQLVSGFAVEGFWNAFWGALLFSIVSFVLNRFFNPWRTGYTAPLREAQPQQYRNVIDAEIVPPKDEGEDKRNTP